MLDRATKWGGDGKARRGPGLPGRLALGLGGLHALLLFFPPIPPDVKGSLWSYLLAGSAVVLAVVELRPRASAVVRAWTELGRPARQGLVLGTVVVLLISGLVLHAVAPGLFYRWSDDEGIYQPATMLAYLAAALALTSVARRAAGADRPHLRLLGAGFLVLFLEEIDYFGIFGGVVGRVDGVYVGSLHDLVHLASRGGVDPAAAGMLAGMAVAAPLLAWRLGYLDPRAFPGLFSRAAGVWLMLGAGLMLAAQGMDVGRLGLGGDVAGLEELFEVTASVLWLGSALEAAALGRARGLPEPARDESATTV